jgi:hypothetical protein
MLTAATAGGDAVSCAKTGPTVPGKTPATSENAIARATAAGNRRAEKMRPAAAANRVKLWVEFE